MLNCKSKESWMLNKTILPLLVILLCDRDVCYNFTSFESDVENVMRGLHINRHRQSTHNIVRSKQSVKADYGRTTKLTS